jgi:hypothetical protein
MKRDRQEVAAVANHLQLLFSRALHLFTNKLIVIVTQQGSRNESFIE